MMDNLLSGGAAERAGLSPGRRIYVIGDVHGHRDALARMHDRIRADLAARPVAAPMLVHLGDLIDRGPDSAGCIGLLAQGDPIFGVPTVNLVGNHERMMLGALSAGSHDPIDLWLDNGGDRALASWGLKSSMKPRDWLSGIPASHLVFLNGLSLHSGQDGYLFVHAGVRPGVTLSAQRESDLLWIRDSFLNWNGTMLPEAPHRVIVHGHTSTPEAVIKPNRIGLDTGSGRGGTLTCAVLEGRGIRLFQQ